MTFRKLNISAFWRRSSIGNTTCKHGNWRPGSGRKSPLPIIINGRFLSAGPTGVHRVARELVGGLLHRIAKYPDLSEHISLELWIPADAQAAAAEAGFPARIVGPFTGIPWEQVTLPMQARGSVVLSLCNVGPILTSQAITMFHDSQVRTTPKSYRMSFRIWYYIHQSIAGLRHLRILTVSNFSRDQISHFGTAPRARIGVARNGVDHFSAVNADPSLVDLLGLCEKTFVVALANTQPHKNIGVLLEAFGERSLAGIHLVLFGEARASDFLKMGYAVPGNVIFAGRVSDGQLRALYEHALCIAFPSLTEGFGLPPLEAMSVGCPALVAPEGALPEICGDAVIYVDARDPAAWGRAVLDLLNDPSHRDSLTMRGVQQAAEFTWEKATDAVLAELLLLAMRS